MGRPFHTAPMRDGIRYDSRGEPVMTTRDTPEAACQIMGASPYASDQGSLCLTHNRKFRECRDTPPIPAAVAALVRRGSWPNEGLTGFERFWKDD